MSSHSWNKLLAGSVALATAGVLTCAAVVLDAFIPKSSLAAFLTSAALLGFVVTGVLITYTWICDSCESYSPRRASLPTDDKQAASSVAATGKCWAC